VALQVLSREANFSHSPEHIASAAARHEGARRVSANSSHRAGPVRLERRISVGSLDSLLAQTAAHETVFRARTDEPQPWRDATRRCGGTPVPRAIWSSAWSAPRTSHGALLYLVSVGCRCARQSCARAHRIAHWPTSSVRSSLNPCVCSAHQCSSANALILHAVSA
jgi:hypothetical protein